MTDIASWSRLPPTLHVDGQHSRLTEEPSYLLDTEGMQSYRRRRGAGRPPARGHREGVMALIRWSTQSTAAVPHLRRFGLALCSGGEPRGFT
jgi:hypothetical protein